MKPWLWPSVLALAIFIVTLQLLATRAPDTKELLDYVADHKIEVKADTVGGYAQVYYVYDNVKVYITSGNINHTSPYQNGHYITWTEAINGAPQVVRYNLADKTRLQLTFSGSNVNSRVDNGKVVWQRAQKDGYQIYIYDNNIRQISEGYSSLYPEISDDRAVYAQQISNTLWRSVLYSIKTEELHVLAEGDSTIARPHFRDNEIKVRMYE